MNVECRQVRGAKAGGSMRRSRTTSHPSTKMTGMSALLESPLLQPGFWQQPLADRMAKIAEIRAEGPFHPAEFENPMSGLVERFYAVTRYEEVVEISKRPQDFCSG